MSGNQIAPTGKYLRNLKGIREIEAVLPPTDTSLSLVDVRFCCGLGDFGGFYSTWSCRHSWPFLLPPQEGLGGKPEMTFPEFCSFNPYNSL